MRKPIIIVLVLVVLSVSAASYFYFFNHTTERGIEATVSRVLDGDTIELANHDVVRLIGIDAPEKDQQYSKEVIDQLRKLEGKVIRMEKDKTNKDRYGRYLRYVFLEDHFVNLELVQEGLVYAYIVNPDKKYEREFLEAENIARSNGLGIWSRSDYSDCIELKTFHYNAKGDDNENTVDEFFVIRNVCEDGVSARGWSVRNTFNSFRLPEFSLVGGSEVKIISGKGESSAKEVFLSSERPIWNNKGDVLYLKDGIGSVILSKSYKNE